MSKTNNSRRDFVKKTLLAASVAGIGIPSGLAANANPKQKISGTPEWRNQQSDMEYRALGKTGLMVSAMVIGGARLNPKRYDYVAPAIERGVNYVDTAARYGGGNSELGVAKVLQMVGREKLFVSTKLSAYLPLIDQYCQDIYKGLPASKQNALLEMSKKLIQTRGVDKAGYYYKFFPPQDSEFPDGYLTYVIRKEYGAMNKWKSFIKKELLKSVDESLVRLETDYVDILHCPHGARVPEELEDETIREVMEEVKRAGKARFSGLSIHSDVPGNLEKAAEMGVYDMAMVAYNIVNHDSMVLPLKKAIESDMGIIAMKAAAAVNTNFEELKPIPQWRIDKLNAAIPGDMKTPLKAYLWVLQNPSISGTISDFQNEEMVLENLSIVGKKVDIHQI